MLRSFLMRKRVSIKKLGNPKRRSSALPCKRKTQAKARIVIDPVSGFPALTLGPGAPVLTSKEVEEILSDFP
jgi:phospholipid N-methyltransferase